MVSAARLCPIQRRDDMKGMEIAASLVSQEPALELTAGDSQETRQEFPAE
jgi:hypothetical protein